MASPSRTLTGLTGLRRPHFPTDWSSIPLSPSNLTLANTLPVGQSFLWHRHPISHPEVEEEYSRAIPNPPRVICLRQSPTALYFTAIHPTPAATEADRREGTTRKWIEDYFQLRRYPDLEGLYADWRGRDPSFFGRVELGPKAVGVRVVRQDTWECLVAFITSTNNHIPRISSLMHRLSGRFSPPLLTLSHPSEDEEIVYRLFPQPQDLPSAGLEPILRDLGFGYRAGFLASSLATLRAEGPVVEQLDAMRGVEGSEVRDKLVRLKGVGKKVADCVGLMCMDQHSLIPIDTHIYAIAARHPSFPSTLRKKTMSPALYDDIQEFLAEKWGPMGGWCQAVVFAADLKTSTTPKKSASGTPSKPVTPRKRSTPSQSATPIKLEWPDDTPSKSATPVKRERPDLTPSKSATPVKLEGPGHLPTPVTPRGKGEERGRSGSLKVELESEEPERKRRRSTRMVNKRG